MPNPVDSKFTKYYTLENKNIIKSIVKQQCFRVRLNYEDCLDFVYTKFPGIVERFDERVGKDFHNFLKVSVRGYCLNYIRDNSYAVKVSSTYKAYAVHYNKTGSFRLTMKHFGIDADTLQKAISEVDLALTEYGNHLFEADTSSEPAEDFSELHEVCTAIDFELLYSMYVDKEPEIKLINRYGSKYGERAKALVSSIKDKKLGYQKS